MSDDADQFEDKNRRALRRLVRKHSAEASSKLMLWTLLVSAAGFVVYVLGASPADVDILKKLGVPESLLPWLLLFVSALQVVLGILDYRRLKDDLTTEAKRLAADAETRNAERGMLGSEPEPSTRLMHLMPESLWVFTLWLGPLVLAGVALGWRYF